MRLWSGNSMKYQINSTGTVLLADAEFINRYYPGDFTEVVETAPVVIDPCEWLLDLGPFYDRFGAAKMPVLTSPDATVKAIIADCNIRKWIDLENPDVASGLAYIGTVVAALTPAIQTAILTTPVTAEENRALRRVYF